MKTRRIIAGLVSASMLGVAPLAFAAPSQADEASSEVASEAKKAFAPTIELKPAHKKLVHGTKTYFSGTITYVDETGARQYVSGGTATLQRATTKKPKKWVTVGTDTYPSSLYFSDVKVPANSRFRVVYSGFTAQYSSQDSITAGTSKPKRVNVARKMTYKNRKGFKITGRVTPQFKRKKLVIKVSKRQKGGYKNWKKVRTNKKGRYTIRLPKRRGTWYWKIIAKGNKHYKKNFIGWRTWVS